MSVCIEMFYRVAVLKLFFGKLVFDRFLMRLKTEGGLKPRAAYISSQAYQLRVNTEGGLIPRAT